MGFKNNWTTITNKLKNKASKLKDKAKDKTASLLNKVKPSLERVMNFIGNNKGFVIVTLTTLVGSSSVISVISLTLPEFAKLLSDSTLVSLAGKQYTKNQLLSVLKQLKEGEMFTSCTFEPLVRNLDLSDVDKARKFYVYLGSIENIGNIDLKNHLVLCIITTLVRLYFSNCSNFNTIIEGLLNALKRGYLSKRLFELIMAMLRKRGVPVHEILAMLESHE